MSKNINPLSTKNKFVFASLLLLICCLNSCVSKSKINYFQVKNENDSLQLLTKQNFTTILRKDDLLKIEISSPDIESIKPFIFQSTQTNNQVPNYSNGVAASSGYLIDSDGNITLPTVGKIKVVDLSKMEATELIKSKLKQYLSDPVVNISIQNYKITVLGDVRSPGSYTIPNERITLPEIIGVAGDLNITGLRTNILVIRDINGVKTEYRVDLTSKDIFRSPVYYLSQNDVIYVEPNRAKRNSSLISATSGIFISVASLLITTINVLTK